MLERRRFAVPVLIFTAVLLFLLLFLATSTTGEKNIFVDNNADPGGDGSPERPFITIQEGVNASVDGDIVRVLEGLYAANISIETNISILGAGPQKSYITAYQGPSAALNVMADNVTISGFTMNRGDYLSSSSAVMLRANGTRIFDCRISDYSFSIQGFNVSGAEIANCRFEAGTYSTYPVYLREVKNSTIQNCSFIVGETTSYGVDLRSCEGIRVENSTMQNQRRGIRLEDSLNVQIQNNTIRNQLYSTPLLVLRSRDVLIKGNSIENYTSYYRSIRLEDSLDCKLLENTIQYGEIYISGKENEHWMSHEMDESNTVWNRTLRVYKNLSQERINGEEAGQLILLNCHNLTVENMNLTQAAGVLIAYSSGNTLANISISWANKGIYLHQSQNNSFHNITVSLSISTGIELGQGCHDNSFTGCTLRNQPTGIYLTWVQRTSFFGNLFTENKDHGIRAYNATDLTLKDNVFLGCSLSLEGNSWEYWSFHQIDSSNMVNGRPLRYYSNFTGKTLSVETGQLILAGCSDMVAQGIDFGNRSGSIQLLDSHRCLIADNILTRPEDEQSSTMGQTGIYLYRSSNNTITGNRCERNLGDGIALRYSHDNHLLDNTCSHNEEDGIYLYHSQRNTVEGSSCQQNDGNGIHLSYVVEENLLEENTCIQNQRDGIDSSGGSRNSYLKNVCQNNRDNGMEIRSSNNVTLEENVCERNDYSGMRIKNSENVTILRNTLEDNDRNGIDLSQGLHSLVQENTLVDDRISIQGQEIRVLNNTIRESGTGISIRPNSRGTVVSGNLLMNCSTGMYLEQDWGSGQEDLEGVLVANNSFSGCNTGIRLWGVEDSTIRENVFLEGGGICIYVYKAENCSISRNTMLGGEEARKGFTLWEAKNNSFTRNTITGFDTGIFVGNRSRDNEIHGNFIYGNRDCGLNASEEDTPPVNATGNWWGSKDGPRNFAANPHGTGDDVLGPVDFSEWLTTGPGLPNSDDESGDQRAMSPLLSPLLLLLALLFGALAYLVKLPEEPSVGKEGKAEAAKEQGKKEKEEENTGRGTANCPNCGGNFNIDGIKLPARFICHFCHEEIELDQEEEET